MVVGETMVEGETSWASVTVRTPDMETLHPTCRTPAFLPERDAGRRKEEEDKEDKEEEEK